MLIRMMYLNVQHVVVLTQVHTLYSINSITANHSSLIKSGNLAINGIVARLETTLQYELVHAWSCLSNWNFLRWRSSSSGRWSDDGGSQFAFYVALSVWKWVTDNTENNMCLIQKNKGKETLCTIIITQYPGRITLYKTFTILVGNMITNLCTISSSDIVKAALDGHFKKSYIVVVSESVFHQWYFFYELFN